MWIYEHFPNTDARVERDNYVEVLSRALQYTCRKLLPITPYKAELDVLIIDGVT